MPSSQYSWVMYWYNSKKVIVQLAMTDTALFFFKNLHYDTGTNDYCNITVAIQLLLVTTMQLHMLTTPHCTCQSVFQPPCTSKQA